MSAISFELTDEVADALIARLGERLERRRWVHIEGLAKYLGCAEGRIYELRARGLPGRRLPGEKEGTLSKKLIFDLREVDEWIEHEGVQV
jgi:hypothetical protein